MSKEHHKPTDKKLQFLYEDVYRWESYEYFIDEDGTLWIRWCNSGSHYHAGEHTVEWFKEGFNDERLREIDYKEINWDAHDESDYYQGVAEDYLLKSIKDKFKELRKELERSD